jgi:hypothetical protein
LRLRKARQLFLRNKEGCIRKAEWFGNAVGNELVEALAGDKLYNAPEYVS